MAGEAHTPGPWKWERRQWWWELVSANGTTVMDDGSAYGEYDARLKPDSADAVLVAEAPSMLDCLEELVAMRHIATQPVRQEEAWNAALAAIARATGKG